MFVSVVPVCMCVCECGVCVYVCVCVSINMFQCVPEPLQLLANIQDVVYFPVFQVVL